MDVEVKRIKNNFSTIQINGQNVDISSESSFYQIYLSKRNDQMNKTTFSKREMLIKRIYNWVCVIAFLWVILLGLFVTFVLFFI